MAASSSSVIVVLCVCPYWGEKDGKWCSIYKMSVEHQVDRLHGHKAQLCVYYGGSYLPPVGQTPLLQTPLISNPQRVVLVVSLVVHPSNAAPITLASSVAICGLTI